jgi:hypothetical protein
MPRQALALSFIVCLPLAPQPVFADGGTLQISRRYDDHQISVFTSPSALREGPIDISVLVQESSSGKVCDDTTIDVELTALDQPEVALKQTATADAATNKFFKSALFEVPHTALWHARIFLNAAAMSREPACEFELSIAPPLPAWIDIAPWLGWPFAIIALFCGHQWLASKTVRLQRAPAAQSAAKQLQIKSLHVS